MNDLNQTSNKLGLDDILKHDTLIHSFGFNPEKCQLILDLDWIVKAEFKSGSYEYQVSPSTLVWDNVWDVQFDLVTNLSITIDDFNVLMRSTPNNVRYLGDASYEYLISLECLEGTIQFRTIGGKLYKRSRDYVGMNSSLSVKDRGGFSLQPIGETFDVVIE